MTGSIPKTSFKSIIFLAAFAASLFNLTSCARGTYYAAGEDYKYHPNRYQKDDFQTMNDPFYRYSQVSTRDINCKKPRKKR